MGEHARPRHRARRVIGVVLLSALATVYLVRRQRLEAAQRVFDENYR